jgi:membrane protein implicated in regulation of membrane protease activity
VQWFPTLNDKFGLPKVMILFAVLAVLAILFVYRFLPETKGLPLEEVTAVFDRQAEESPI